MINWDFVANWSLLASLFCSLMLVLTAFPGLQRFVRDADGNHIKPTPPAGKIIKAGFALVLFGFFLLAASRLIRLQLVRPPLFFIFLHKFLIFFAVLLFATIVIDILIIVLWHPAFLKLPNTEGYTSAVFHLKTLLLGTLYGVVFAAIIALAVHFLL